MPSLRKPLLVIIGLASLCLVLNTVPCRADDTKTKESKLTKANYEKIKTGMSPKEVQDILGEGKDMPASDYQARTRVQLRIKQILENGGTALKWQEGKKQIIVIFKNKKVTAQSSRNLPDMK